MTDKSFGERERLAVVDASGLLGSGPEERFDRIVRLGAFVFNVPMAFFSVVGREHQWLKARYGVEMKESPRDIAFCPHALNSDAPFVVKDAREDPRFATNPLVTAGPRIRFYAGHPVKGPEGAIIGTMCIADRRPWASLPDQKVAALRDLASLIESELALQARSRRKAPRGDSEAHLAVQLRAMLDTGLAGNVLVDSALNIMCFNAAVRQYVALTDDSLGHPIDDQRCLLDYPTLSQDLHDAAEHGHASSQKVCSLSGKLVLVRLTPFRPPQATRYNVLISITDITASRDAEQLTTVLDGLDGNQVCAVDRNGVIVYTNEAWDASAESRGDPLLSKTGPGGNYLNALSARRSPHHRRLLKALGAVIDGRRSSLSFSYDCSVTGEEPRFTLIHACAVSQQDISAVISHTDITAFVDDARTFQPAIWD